MRKFMIHGELTLRFGNDYEVKLVLNKDNNKDNSKSNNKNDREEDGLEDYPLVGCEWIFKDEIAGVTQRWYGMSKFCGDSFLKDIRQIAKKKLRIAGVEQPFHPVLAALAGKRQLDTIVGNKYWRDHCQSGGLVVEMTASNGKLVSCRYQDIQLRNPALSIDGGEYVDVWTGKIFLNPPEKEGQNIVSANIFGKSVFSMVKVIDSFSFLLDIMEECAALEVTNA